MRSLVLDQSTTTVGWAVVEEDLNSPICHGFYGKLINHGIITTKQARDLPARLSIIRTDIRELVRAYQPQELVIENTTFIKQRSGDTANAMGAIFVSCREIAKDCQLAFYSQNPSTLKKSLTGNGSATKEDVIAQVKHLWGLPTVLDDNHADALGAGLVWLHRGSEVREALAAKKNKKQINYAGRKALK